MTGPITNKLSNREKIVYAWLCTGIVYSMLFWTYLNSILSILLVLYWLIASKKIFDPAEKKSRLMLLFVSLYIAGLLGMLYTQNIDNGIFTLQKQSAILAFPLVFGTTAILTASLVKKITSHFLIATGLSCIAGLAYGLYNFIKSGDASMVTGQNLLVFPDFYPGIMGLFCLLALIIIIDRTRTGSGREMQVLRVLSVLLSIFIFLLSIRLIIFCWFLLLLYFLWTRIRKINYRLLFALGIAVSIIISGLTIPSLKKQWNELIDFSRGNTIVLDKDSSMGRSWGGKAIRIAVWKCSAGILKDHWLTGVGTGDIQDQLQQAYEDRKFYFASRYNKYNAHNQYLQSTLGYGIAGLILLLMCIAVPLIRYRKNFSGESYLLFIILFVMIGVTESILEVNKGIVWYSFFNSIFAFGHLKNKKTQDPGT